MEEEISEAHDVAIPRIQKQLPIAWMGGEGAGMAGIGDERQINNRIPEFAQGRHAAKGVDVHLVLTFVDRVVNAQCETDNIVLVDAGNRAAVVQRCPPPEGLDRGLG